jgi:hypothetical protein
VAHTSVQVHVRQRLQDGRLIERRVVKRLEENFWETPLPGDSIKVEGPREDVSPSGVGENGTISFVTHWDGTVVHAQFRVLRRHWTTDGVTLICEPWPAQFVQHAVAVIEGLQQLGFKDVATLEVADEQEPD